MAANVLVKILTPEIVGHVQVRPAITVVVAPGRGKAVAVIVLVETGARRDVLKGTAAIGGEPIVEQEIRRAVLRVVVRLRIAKLILDLKVDIRTEIQIQAAIAIIVRGGHAGESSLGRRRKSEGVRLVA